MEPTAVIIDPVCGMELDRTSSVAVEYEQRTYYFCGSACADTFRDEPQRWISQDISVEA